jgi:hypothetical protein
MWARHRWPAAAAVFGTSQGTCGATRGRFSRAGSAKRLRDTSPPTKIPCSTARVAVRLIGALPNKVVERACFRRSAVQTAHQRHSAFPEYPQQKRTGRPSMRPQKPSGLTRRPSVRRRVLLATHIRTGLRRAASQVRDVCNNVARTSENRTVPAKRIDFRLSQIRASARRANPGTRERKPGQILSALTQRGIHGR